MKLFFIGFMGCGKSRNGRNIANKLQFEFIDLDRYIEQEVKMTIPGIFSRFGEEVFRQLEREKLLKIIATDKNIVVSTGGGTPCFLHNMDLIKKEGLSIYLSLPEKTLLQRLQKSKQKRPLVDRLSEEELQAAIAEKMLLRTPFYEQADLTINGISMDINHAITLINSHEKFHL